MKEQPFFVVTYDISDDRERYRVDKILRGFGFRVQKSVFECRLRRSDKAALMQTLQKLSVKSGSIKLYRVYEAAEDIVIGKPMKSPDEEFAYVL